MAQGQSPAVDQSAVSALKNNTDGGGCLVNSVVTSLPR
jgi:hypothetical protein